MLFNKKNPEEGQSPSSNVSSTPESSAHTASPERSYERSTPSNALNTICSDTIIEGEVKTNSNMRIDGKIIGTITSEAKVVISSTGVLEGDLICENAEIAGTLNGKVNARGLLILKESAQINGDVVTDKIVIEPGAQIVGVCNMAVKPSRKTAETKVKKSAISENGASKNGNKEVARIQN